MGASPHAIDADDPDALPDDAGRLYVPGYRVAPTAPGATGSGRLYDCPEAALRGPVADLLQLYRVTDGDLPGALAVLGAPPSGAFVDAFDVAAGELAALRSTIREREARRRAPTGRRA